MTSKRAKDNSKALAAFIAAKNDIDEMMERLQNLSDDHWGEDDPEGINWGAVGTLNHYANKLRQITDSAFGEGDHAPAS